MTHERKIVVVGSANVDLIMKMNRLPRVGESVTDAEFRQLFGGKGANQAYAAALAGGTQPPTRVTFVSCVGDDAYGTQVIENMHSAGADVDFVFVAPGVATGTALIMIGDNGRNYISVAPGANYHLTPEHVQRAAAAIEDADLLMLQYEVPVETGFAAAQLARAAGVPVMLNLAPPRPISDEFLGLLDYFIVNETEAAFVLGFDVDSDANVRRAAAALQARGAQNVIITLGERGAFVASQNGLAELVPGISVAAVDTTAAGDTWCGAFAVAMLEGRSLLDAARFANIAAAITVTRIGAQAAVPTRQEISDFASKPPR